MRAVSADEIVAALQGAATLEEAAASLGVSPGRLKRWAKENSVRLQDHLGAGLKAARQERMSPVVAAQAARLLREVYFHLLGVITGLDQETMWRQAVRLRHMVGSAREVLDMWRIFLDELEAFAQAKPDEASLTLVQRAREELHRAFEELSRLN